MSIWTTKKAKKNSPRRTSIQLTLEITELDDEDEDTMWKAAKQMTIKSMKKQIKMAPHQTPKEQNDSK